MEVTKEAIYPDFTFVEMGVCFHVPMEGRGQLWMFSWGVSHSVFQDRVSHWPGPSHTAWTGRSVSQITTHLVSASLALGLQADVTAPCFLCVCWGLNSGPWVCAASTYWPSHIPHPGERFCLLIQCLRYRSVEIFCFFLGQFLVSVFLGVWHFHPGIF